MAFLKICNDFFEHILTFLGWILNLKLHEVLFFLFFVLFQENRLDSIEPSDVIIRLDHRLLASELIGLNESVILLIGLA